MSAALGLERDGEILPELLLRPVHQEVLVLAVAAGGRVEPTRVQGSTGSDEAAIWMQFAADRVELALA